MTTIDKIEHIAKWTSENYDEETNKINHDNGEIDFAQIETMIGEKLPDVFTGIYKKINGELGNKSGILFGLEFLSTKKIISKLEFPLSLLKPVERKVTDPNKSEKILNAISTLFFKSIPNKKKFGFISKKWHKATFSCALGTYSQISVEYDNGEIEKYSLKEEYSDKIFDLGEEIHQLEKKDYNWASLEFELMPNGKYTVKRKDYIWEEEMFSSCPEDKIKKKYYHYKWIPIFHDYSGNFIGIDLDPDKKGVKGQVIIFGSDEQNMVVIADDFEEFLDLTIKEMKKNPKEFTSENHLHDVYRKIKNCA
ncbi:SMI1/KNR4 family protein [Winogradskyella sp. HB-48]|uniref:SMI1/KNR4 family protein n=1 Tax=Winogradskyella sp. HB-48 TaxID=3416808 RepID=UPI003CEF6E9A